MVSMAWTSITNHGRVLLAVAADPQRTLRQIAVEAGVTERATHRIITSLTEAGYLERTRVGRRVHYRLNYRLNVGQLQTERAQRACEARELVAFLGTVSRQDRDMADQDSPGDGRP